MRGVRRSCLLLTLLLPASIALAEPEDVSVHTLKNLSPEKCLQLPAAELATRCPAIAGRFLEIDGKKLALLDRVDQRKGSFLCDGDGDAWRCRKIVVIDRELKGARKRNPQAFVTTAELLRQLATSSSVKLDDEFGALFAPGERPKTCIELPAHGCAVQAARLRGRAQDKNGTPVVRRRLWLVEDGDGTTLQCSDAQLTRCDELTAAGWLALAITLRPSSLAGPELPPEFDLPETRSDKRAGAQVVGGAEASDTPVGALDPWLRPKNARALPKAPSKADVAKTAHLLETKGKPCLKAEDHATVDLIFSGEGQLVSLLVDGVTPDQPLVGCLTATARKLDFPRFAGNTYHLRAAILRATR
jgi:hypothetical protein